MVLNGAEGETKEAIRTTLQQTGLTDSEINVAYKSLIATLDTADPKVVFAMANSSWYREDLTVKKVFENILGSYYDAEINFMDTSDPNTVNLINSWIKNKTNGKITDMLDEVPSDAVMYLINAIYYIASWQYRFNKSKTEERPFYLADTTVNKETMYCDGATIAYYKDNDLQMFDIPYGNRLYYLTILMPYEAADINTRLLRISLPQI